VYVIEGTDEKAIIEVLTRCNNEQRQKTKLLFKTMYGKVELQRVVNILNKFDKILWWWLAA